ncbi:hypothetical protein F0726_00550 [Acidithiobacillus caldus]|nr:hypothetical protein F0726_00550 [Acidithiobacillus caldus]
MPRLAGIAVADLTGSQHPAMAEPFAHDPREDKISQTPFSE